MPTAISNVPDACRVTLSGRQYYENPSPSLEVHITIKLQFLSYKIISYYILSCKFMSSCLSPNSPKT